ncbi:GAF and ANTAR domain-containing protein [Nocardioides hwasunensis]|uniref:GAF and ANTAR domain-containing protein n=1 Tax=Nocardioides hwasunensis TaxID=397258 RepID=A0ABR8MI15_9ACTN|nr:ANTAR domain-containing protein [Nocardioides hwasunensis]MBD3915703.1 GAF and ANTAR domain-containing protein [Nocardioides hwasunensis]
MTIDATALADSLRTLVQSPADDGTLSSSLKLVVEACVDLFDVDGAGILIADEQDVLSYAAASAGPGRLLERMESEAGEGPCTESFWQAKVITSRDVTTETVRWPRLAEAMVGQPVRAVLGTPIQLGGVTVGTLDVYRERVHDWDDSEVTALARYSEVIATTLAAALEAHTAGELAKQLQYALDYRVVIERAVGYLMASMGADAVTAFQALRSTARNRRTKIGTIAEHLLDTGSLPA